MNPLLRRILSSRWHRLASGRTVVLRITGRRTGRHYEVCVGYAQHGADAIDILVSDSSNRTWWRNFDPGGPVRVVLRGQERAGWATAYRAPSQDFKTVADRAILAIVGRRGAARFFALPEFDGTVGLRPEDLESLDGFAVAVAIQLEP